MYVSIKTYNAKSTTKIIDGELENLDSGINSIKSIVDNIAYIWQGNDHDYFEKNMQNFINELTQVASDLRIYNDFVNGYISSLNELNSYYKNKKINLK